jgi:hypothetical protein
MNTLLPRSHRHVPIFLGLALLASAGCSRSADKAGLASSDSGVAASGVTIVVSYQNQSFPVDLGSIPTTTVNGEKLIKLSDVWSAAHIKADRSSLEYELIGADGFTPAVKGCADLSGVMLEKGFIDGTSRNLWWDASFGSRRCYSVKNLAKMNAHEPTGGPAPKASEGKL